MLERSLQCHAKTGDCEVTLGVPRSRNDGKECMDLDAGSRAEWPRPACPGGKEGETHLETEGGRTVYEVEMVDTAK
jgi:hypothetical protein